MNYFGRRTKLHLGLEPSKIYTGIAFACKRKSHFWNKKIYCSFHDEESQSHAVHQLSDGRHQKDEEELIVVVARKEICHPVPESIRIPSNFDL